MSSRKGFTLIELLVVIAIIAILAVVVVLTLNPAQLLAQSRDANRVSDMATVNSAINLYMTDQAGAAGFSLGTSSITDISIPSSATNCSTLGMASSTYPYWCSSSSNYRLASSTGWIPINFNQISAGSPFGSVPVDPVNQTSSNLYYTYTTNGSVYEINAFPESQKYAKNAFNEGGNDPTLLEAGNGINILPDAGRGLVAYFPLSEGTANTAVDWSGGGNNATWMGSPSGTNGYYSPGKTSQWAGYFNGSTVAGVSSYAVTASATAASAYNFTGPITMSAWVYPQITNQWQCIIFHGSASLGRHYAMYLSLNGVNYIYVALGNNNGTNFTLSVPWAVNAWNFIVATDDGTTLNIYVNGRLSYSGAYAYDAVAANDPLSIGYDLGTTPGFNFNGEINDARVYDRVLSPSEILEMYNAEK